MGRGGSQKEKAMEVQKDIWKNEDISHKIVFLVTVLSESQPLAYGKQSLGDRHQQAGVHSFV